MNERPVDPERIAALLDGRLDPAERAGVLERLAGSEEALGAFADAAAVARELEAEDAASGVVPLRPRSVRPAWPRPWLAAAAAVAALVLLPLGVWLSRPAGVASPAAVVAMLEAPAADLPEEWDVRPWPARRGAVDGAGAARLGVFLVDLEVAARSRDSAVAVLAGRVALLLDAVPGGGTTADVYRGIAARAGAPFAELEPALREGADGVASLVDREMLAVGAWAEGALLAALREDAAFFRARGSRRMMDVAERRLAGDAAALDALARLRAALDADAPDWSEVRSGAEGVLGRLP